MTEVVKGIKMTIHHYPRVLFSWPCSSVSSDLFSAPKTEWRRVQSGVGI